MLRRRVKTPCRLDGQKHLPGRRASVAAGRSVSRFSSVCGCRGERINPAFKAVLLEGVEVAFIVLAVSAGGDGLLAAATLVTFVAVATHRPLARVPENTLKLAVGVVISGFGIFWTGECPMGALKAITAEIIHLFVDDGSLVLALVAWCGAIGLATTVLPESLRHLAWRSFLVAI
jgi:hypothetical protein